MTTPITPAAARAAEPAGAAPRQQYTPIAHTDVTIEDAFWAPRVEANRASTIGHIYRELYQTGRIDAFRPG